MPESLLLDGQQRITSLYQTTMRQDVVDTMNSNKQKIKRFYYIDMAAALGTFNCSMTDANRKLIAAEIARLLGVAVPVPNQLRAVSMAMAPLNSRW